MAQLNPTFEIDFNDINSYEQIQLMNDTQLAKENLLMHRAYQEPADDEIIRNHFSSFTFVDFCPKLFTIKQSRLPSKCPGPAHAAAPPSAGSPSPAAINYYELETFSDLFERINKWLKLNKDWRVVSMETLVFDCKSHFNYLKSSIHSIYLPQNTRGLRLFLSPSKSRFSGPQKIGCINVVPRKLSGSHASPADEQQPVVYETLDQILDRLNELLLSRPIEGRILSVETITLPMSNGFVNTESNYYMDSRLNMLRQFTYGGACWSRAANSGPPPPSAPPDGPEGGRSGSLSSAASSEPATLGHCLIDILRVYYEFGPTVGGLVNMIDFIPRFYSPTPTGHQHEQSQAPADGSAGGAQQAATESLTRLIRRSLAWFESERKRVLAETTPPAEGGAGEQVNLRVCNLQVCHKSMLKHQLLGVNPSNVIETANTRSMLHESVRSRPPVVCALCGISSGSAEPQDWCSHLLEQTQIYQLKYVRLAYVVPVHSKFAKLIYPIRSLRGAKQAPGSSRPAATCSSSSTCSSSPTSSCSSSCSSPSASASASPSPARPASVSASVSPAQSPGATRRRRADKRGDSQAPAHEIDPALVKEMLSSSQQEHWNRQAALAIVSATNDRHRQQERSHQLAATDGALNDAPIGQLTYRLFAPCQLVKSSSCFSINPVNSSSPLSRRGSLDLNGSGVSSEEAHPSNSPLLAGHSQTNLIGDLSGSGPFFPHLNTGDLLSVARPSQQQQETMGGAGKHFAWNEFEPLEAIKRRMEVYVTTNSMKVIAGETLIINLSDSLACLSTAIEQTVVRAPPARTRPSTWVCVYVLYAAVDEPHLASQHYQQQQQQQRPSRQLELIDEELDVEPHFDDDFKCDAEQPQQQQSDAEAPERPAGQPAEEQADAGARSSADIYNSAYDRTVALPTSPDNSDTINKPMEAVEIMGSQTDDYLWLDEADLAEIQQQQDQYRHFETFQHLTGRRESRKAGAKKRRQAKKLHDHDSQCSLI